MLYFIFIIAISLFLWNLLTQGMLWKIIISIFGWIGLYQFLIQKFPETKQICFMFSNKTFSWAEIIPTFILLMAMLYSKN